MVHSIECFLEVNTKEAGSSPRILQRAKYLLPGTDQEVVRANSFDPAVLVLGQVGFLLEIVQDKQF